MVNALYALPNNEDIPRIVYYNTKAGKERLIAAGGSTPYVGFFGDLPRGYREYFKFTYVRNPFERLVSTYEHKYHVNSEGYYGNYLFGYIAKDEGFEKFVRKIVKIPYAFLEEHFSLQYLCVYKHNKPVVDYIGKFEEIDETFPQILEKYHLGPMFERKNTTAAKAKWMDYYSSELADLVYKKYKKDIVAFGYEDIYFALKEHCNKQEQKVYG
jgi:hypothetical protein